MDLNTFLLSLQFNLQLNNYITLIDHLIVVHNLSIIDEENFPCVQRFHT